MNSLSWVIYLKPVFKRHAMKVVCEQTEWDQLEATRPGINTFFQGGFTSEGAAEAAARGPEPTERYGWMKRR